MTWIAPLNMSQWMVNVFAGDSNFFGVIAVMAIAGMAGYFRMMGLTMFFLLGVFILMFADYVPEGFTTLAAIAAGLAIGYAISKIVKD
jgi:hypothetical protein